MQRAGSGLKQIFSGAALLVGVALLAGCSSAKDIGSAGPYQLGAPDLAQSSQTNDSAAQPAESQTRPNVTSGKVLSAIVFERVTGLEVDPARLIEP
jgi:hypothetical protein